MKQNNAALVGGYLVLLVLLVISGYVAAQSILHPEGEADLSVTKDSLPATSVSREIITLSTVVIVSPTEQASPVPDGERPATIAPDSLYPQPDVLSATATLISDNLPYPGPIVVLRPQPAVPYPGQGTEMPEASQQPTSTPTPRTAVSITITPSPTPPIAPTQALDPSLITLTPTATLTPAVVRTELRASDPASFQIISGRVQLVEFFAFWSPISKSMAVVVNGLEDRYKDQINFIYLDLDDPANSLFKRMIGNRLPPIFYLLDTRGNVLAEWEGYVPASEFEAAFPSAFP